MTSLRKKVQVVYCLCCCCQARWSTPVTRVSKMTLGSVRVRRSRAASCKFCFLYRNLTATNQQRCARMLMRYHAPPVRVEKGCRKRKRKMMAFVDNVYSITPHQIQVRVQQQGYPASAANPYHSFTINTINSTTVRGCWPRRRQLP